MTATAAAGTHGATAGADRERGSGSRNPGARGFAPGVACSDRTDPRLTARAGGPFPAREAAGDAAGARIVASEAARAGRAGRAAGAAERQSAARRAQSAAADRRPA